jgi:hypothetical protein
MALMMARSPWSQRNTPGAGYPQDIKSEKPVATGKGKTYCRVCGRRDAHVVSYLQIPDGYIGQNCSGCLEEWKSQQAMDEWKSRILED